MSASNRQAYQNGTDINSDAFGTTSPPLARWVSAQAKARFEAIKAESPPPNASVEELRVHYDCINSARLDVATRDYPVDVQSSMVGGVPAYLVNHSSANRDKLLICLHGGAFMWGNGAGALIEAVPVAAVAKLPVLAVQYRLAPEHAYPCAVEDVLTVIDNLRSENPDLKLGIYGCSAGAVLTAQVVSRMIARGDRLPDAIAMLHAAGLELGGDTLELAALVNGTQDAASVRCLHNLSYFVGTDPEDPLVFPGEHPAVLAQFPPSLLISGTRDFAASSVATMHRRLRTAGREAELTLFDGMWHSHHVDVDLPESAEVFATLAEFFNRHLR
ncbi:alpha/beta hydrolase fold domain-containing protein [Sphingobium sp. WCS2017Hpa-17]|uniref:alpha/beta hydrolase n=1 Tax=Sphingobium sp. WCS2017Hpa-17 TaxID=3073638 RepID=UPI00288B4A00|nr:alpha/beta hydrolase fold domain-containing protein [Sphingobium sp. WCS2017Hpa-17]